MSELAISPVFPWWLILLCLGIGLALSYRQYRVTRDRLGSKKAFIISSLRLCAIILVVTPALNPSFVVRNKRILLPSIAILVDTSRSMGQPASPGGASRLDEARSLLTKGPSPLLKSLREKFDVNIYGLADSPRPLEVSDPALLTADGGAADFGAALKALSGKNSLALLLSDGNLRWQAAGKPQIPAITVPLSNQSSYRDVLIKEIKAPSLAFRGREIVVDVTIKGYGYAGLALPVFLKDSGKLLASTVVKIPSDSGEAIASLAFVPGEAGRRNLSISIPPQAEESIAANNRIDFPLKVVRDKIRILMASGTPSLNYRFLRTALKSDPSVDLLSFVILRTPSDILNVPTQEQSLIPFPAETLFTKELPDFDLVIFDNFDYAIYLRPAYLESLRNFVRRGGGFALIGGPNLFNEGMNGSSPLGEMLPVRFSANQFYQRELPSRVRSSRSGTAHPITRFPDYPPEERGGSRFWQEMPALDGINVLDAKQAASVLLESADAIPWPILTVSDYGRGRTLVLATDYAWKWHMGMVAMGRGDKPYLILVHRMIRWLTKDPSLEPVQIMLPEAVPPPGRETEVRIQSTADDSLLGPDRAFSLSVFDPGGAKIEARLKPTLKPGEYRVTFVPGKGGAYRISLETPLLHLEETLAVPGALERFDAAPDHGQLKRIAAETGGKYVSPEENIRLIIDDYARKSERQFIEEGHLPLWATSGMMTFILALLAAEWHFRRRWGLM